MSSQDRFTLVPASYVYLRRGDQILLQQRSNTGYMDGCWVAAAAGHLEPGETAAQAATREAAEELGIAIAHEDLSFLTVMQRTDGTPASLEQRVDWFWTTSTWTGTPRIAEPNKCSGLQWFDPRSLPPNIPEYERLVLQHWLNNTLPPNTIYGFSGDKPDRHSGAKST